MIKATKIAFTLFISLLYSNSLAQKADLAISNVTLVDGTGGKGQTGKTILIKDGRFLDK